MGRRDPDPRPPIEIVGQEPVPASVQVVSRGPARPGRPSGRALLVALGVAALLLAGLVLGGDDDPQPTAGGAEEERDNAARVPLKERRTTTSRRSTTSTRPTTTTTTRPPGPIFGEPLGVRLLVWGNGPGWRLVHADTGGIVDLDLPSGDPWDATAVGAGVVLVGDDRQARFVELGAAGVEQAVVLGAADRVLPAGADDRVWLIDTGGDGFEGGPPRQPVGTVTLVGIDGQVLRSFPVAAPYVQSAVPEGAVTERGGRVYLVDEGGAREVAVGSLLGVIGEDLLVFACDEAARCGLVRQPVDGGRPRPLRVDDADEEVFDVQTADDGTIALIGYTAEEDGVGLTLLDADGGPLAAFTNAEVPFGGSPRWLPGGRGLLVPNGRGVRWITSAGGGWAVTPVPALDPEAVEVLLVIP